ncbi:MAG: DUF4007 family protein [Pyrinomonadaceae bacterium]|nr:DUF4007 family protein [Pyrinomonadaceae bacterium]
MQIASFSGHETFSFRYGWLTKGVNAIALNPHVFSSQRAMIELGVGKNMVNSIRHWCIVTNLIQSEIGVPSTKSGYAVTPLGKLLLTENGSDPFLEDPATLWLLHWLITSNVEQCTTWYWLFNVFNSIEFTKKQIADEITKWLEQRGSKPPSENTLSRDIDCCVRTYVHSKLSKNTVFDDSFDCPLTEISIIEEVADFEDGKLFQFQRGEKTSLQKEIFLFALSEFWKKYYQNNKSLAIEKIVYDSGSPGRVFKLDEESIMQRLENIYDLSQGVFSFGETAGLKQIYKQKEIFSSYWLESYYYQK